MITIGTTVALAASPLIAGLAVGFVAERRSVVGALLASYLVAWGVVLGVVAALSQPGLVDRGSVAAVELGVAAIAVTLWAVNGRPLPVLRVEVRRLLRDPTLVVLAVAVTASLAYGAWLTLGLAPNTYDSMTYHLPRAAQWLQLESVAWIDNAPTARQNVFPTGAEVGALQTMLVSRSDRLVELPQLVAVVALVASTFGIARRLGAQIREAALAGLIFATLSAVALQSTTTQNDLIVASFVSVAAFFVLSDARAAPVLAGLATALALGTKLTAVFALPVLVLLVLARRKLRRGCATGAAAALFSLALAAPVLIRNVAETGSLMSGDGVDEHRADAAFGAVASSVIRAAYRMLDLSGYSYVTMFELAAAALVMLVARAALPSRISRAWVGAALVLAAPLAVAVASLAVGALLERLGLESPFRGWTLNRRANEDISYLGPLAAALLVPASVIVLARGPRRAPCAWVLALSFPLFTVALALAYDFNAWWGRFLIIPAALTAPLLPVLLRRRGVAVGAAVVGVATLGLAHANNVFKPTWVGDRAVAWQLSRPEMMALTGLSGSEASAYAAFERLDDRIGALVGPDDPHYALWDAGLRRTVVYLPRQAPEHAAISAGLDTVVLGPGMARTAFHRCEWARSGVGAGWVILRRRPPSNVAACA